LRNYAEERGWDTLLIPDGVGGRFSVLSAVGLFPAAMCGVNITEMLDGAHAMARTCHATKENAAATLAAFLIGHTHEQRPIQIMMPYCDSLDNLAHWWVQLWSESLGKIDKNNARVGPTPIVAIGATDQHSMLQLWREGPTDKVVGFIGIDKGDDFNLGTEAISDTVTWLCGKTIREVLHAEQLATTQAVSEAEQPTWTLTIPHIDAGTIGQFFALWEITTAIAGRLLQVNPYDQPGVELGKQLTAEKLQNR
jgi:glucose-6-phosphate isomerase